MVTLDYIVLAAYFVVMIGIGVWTALKVKAQEDFFMGGRSFGKLLQTFAAFGAGTGSSDPVNAARTTFTSGMSGMWSVMYWLFVTPFYWITGVWYRRMRHLTLGDWFVERYESRAMGAGYAIFGLLFFMVYGSMMFSAIGKVAAPLVGFDTFVFNGQSYGIEYLLVPIIGVVVLLYGIMGGLRAAYYTDLIQGLCIILLSVMLIPFGLNALVKQFGSQGDGLMAGFQIIHEQLPKESFSIVGSASSSEFPLHRIIAIVIINLIGIVVQPHFIATGGGSAKTETNARVGLVVGNFLKRFCTIGWVLTALIATALYAQRPELVADPDRTWGVASRDLLPPGLTGLMLACLLAALMSSADAYMIVGSGLMVRNLYAPYINPNASEKEYVRLARMTGVIVIAGACALSMMTMDVFLQLQLTWVFNILFAAPFWIGMYWRRATKAAAWITVAYCTLVFFLVPYFAPRFMPSLLTKPSLAVVNDVVVTTTERQAAPSDVRKREAAIQLWESAQKRIADMPEASDAERAKKQLDMNKLGTRPAPLAVGDTFTETERTGGKGIYWTGNMTPVDASGAPLPDVKPQPVGDPVKISEHATQVVLRYPEGTRLKGSGNFQLDYLMYDVLGVDLTNKSNAALDTLSLPPKIVTPFLVMILFSFVTARNSKQGLDRYYAKMKTPVVPDHEQDLKNLEAAYANPEQFEQKKLFPGSSLEFSRPTRTDVVGFIACFAVCFAIVGLAVLVANIGS